jgi:hypothetical protein
MKRFTVFGLCFAVCLAFGVMFSASAFAKGEHGVLVVTSHNGPSEFGGGGKAALKSTSADGGGEFTTATSGTAFSIFHSVELIAAGLKCNSAGQAAGDVKTETLTEETGWISKGAGQAGVDFKPAAGLYLAILHCGPVEVKVSGSVIGETSPNNVSSLTSKLDLRANAGKTANAPEKFEAPAPKDTLSSEVCTPGCAAASESYQQQENITVTNHGNKSVCKVKKGKEKCKPAPAETNTLANPAQPEVGRCVKKGGGKFDSSNCDKLATAKGKFEFVPVPG